MANLQIPITINFDPINIIGYAEIDEEKLPAKPDYHFAISGQILESEEDGVPAKIKLTGLGLVPDASFKPLEAFVSIDKGEPGGDKTAECSGFIDKTGKIIIEDVKLKEEQSKEEVLPRNVESQEQSFEAFWELREETLNAHLKGLCVEAEISLQTPEARIRFIEMLKDFEREDALDQRKEEIKSLDIADKDILLLKNENHFVCEKLLKAIEKSTGKKVFVISLQEPAELVKLSSEALDQIGLQKKTE